MLESFKVLSKKIAFNQHPHLKLRKFISVTKMTLGRVKCNDLECPSVLRKQLNKTGSIEKN